jgi:hypothetical protein
MLYGFAKASITLEDPDVLLSSRHSVLIFYLIQNLAVHTEAQPL